MPDRISITVTTEGGTIYQAYSPRPIEELIRNAGRCMGQDAGCIELQGDMGCDDHQQVGHPGYPDRAGLRCLTSSRSPIPA